MAIAAFLDRVLQRRDLAPFAHFGLPLDGAGGHVGIDAQFAQGVGDFFHLVGAAGAVIGHAFEVVFDHVRPVEAGKAVRQRLENLRLDAGAMRGQKTFERQRLQPLDHHAAHHLDGGGGADGFAGERDLHVERLQQRRERCRMRPGQQHRRLVQRRMHRRHHRDIDVAHRAVERLRGFLLAAGRDRVDVEIELVGPQIRLRRHRRIEARCRRHRRQHDVRACATASCAEAARRAPIVSAAARMLVAGSFRKQDVPRAQLRRRRRCAGRTPAPDRPRRSR